MIDAAQAPLALALAAQRRGADRAEAMAAQADQADDPGLARLLRAAAASRRVHARRLGRFLRGKLGPAAEAGQAFREESAAAVQFMEAQVAAAAGLEAPARSALAQTRAVEESLAGLAPASQYWVCSVCGHVAGEAVPERCPVCGAVRTKFERLD